MHDRFQKAEDLRRALFPAMQQGLRLVCQNGIFRGRQWTLLPGRPLRIGRQPFCEISYPPDMTVISGLHCTVAMDENGQLLIRDENSRNGTCVENRYLQGGIWYRARRGCRIRFAQEEYRIE